MKARFSQSFQQSARGFTLIEILVATSIFAALLGSLYAVLRGAFQLRETTFEAVESGLPRDYIASLIRRDFASLMPPVGLLAGPMIGEKTEENGQTTSRLEFYTASGIIRDQDSWGDIQKVEYYLLEPDEEGTGASVSAQGFDLVRGVTRNLLPPVEEAPEEQRLLSGVQTLTFGYYDGETWQETWDSTTMENATPVAVRMRIDFSPDGAEPVPPIELVCEIVAKPRTAASAAGPAGGT